MGTNGFRDDELVSRKVKVGNEWQTRVFPVWAAGCDWPMRKTENLNLQTEMVSWDGQYAIFKCSLSRARASSSVMALPTAREMPDSRRV